VKAVEGCDRAFFAPLADSAAFVRALAALREGRDRARSPE